MLSFNILEPFLVVIPTDSNPLKTGKDFPAKHLFNVKKSLPDFSDKGKSLAKKS